MRLCRAKWLRQAKRLRRAKIVSLSKGLNLFSQKNALFLTISAAYFYI